jgi:adenylate cyclase
MLARLSPSARRNALRILPFGVIWLLLAQVFLVSDWAAAGGFQHVPESAIKLDVRIYLFATLAVAAVGCAVGAAELLVLNRWLRTASLGAKLLAKTTAYVLFLGAVILVTYPVVAAMEMDTTLFDERVWERLRGFAISKTSLATGVQLATSLAVSLFYAETSEHMGAQVMSNFLLGRYHAPKQERRLFLFSDMKGSTGIAERLGHARYFRLLQAYYDAFSEAIVEHGGEVYQYIGDEIVVSWPEADGLRDGACLRCVRQMQRDLGRRAAWFSSEFGEVPAFRAGLQVGAVTTGEVGALKREIVFTGDVLNQTARLQALCKAVGEDVLIGDALRARIGAGPWAFRSLGERTLRGKHEPVEVFALRPATKPAERGRRADPLQPAS